MVNLEELPNELIRKILKYHVQTSHPRAPRGDLRAVSATCKRLLEVARSLVWNILRVDISPGVSLAWSIERLRYVIQTVGIRRSIVEIHVKVEGSDSEDDHCWETEMVWEFVWMVSGLLTGGCESLAVFTWEESPPSLGPQPSLEVALARSNLKHLRYLPSLYMGPPTAWLPTRNLSSIEITTPNVVETFSALANVPTLSNVRVMESGTQAWRGRQADEISPIDPQFWKRIRRLSLAFRNSMSCNLLIQAIRSGPPDRSSPTFLELLEIRMPDQASDNNTFVPTLLELLSPARVKELVVPFANILPGPPNDHRIRLPELEINQLTLDFGREAGRERIMQLADVMPAYGKGLHTLFIQTQGQSQSRGRTTSLRETMVRWNFVGALGTTPDEVKAAKSRVISQYANDTGLLEIANLCPTLERIVDGFHWHVVWDVTRRNDGRVELNPSGCYAFPSNELKWFIRGCSPGDPYRSRKQIVVYACPTFTFEGNKRLRCQQGAVYKYESDWGLAS